MDTDASVRALAPSSLFGGSRESLPLSVLSSNIDTGLTVAPHQARASVVGGPNERASIYSATGIAPALPSERNSVSLLSILFLSFIRVELSNDEYY